MDKTKLASFRAILEEIRFAITGGAQEKYKSKKEHLSEQVADITDDAIQSFDRQLVMELGEKELKKLRLVEEAIARINDGQYGVCPECGELISEKRLMVVPFASHCIDCLTALEKNTRI